MKRTRSEDAFRGRWQALNVQYLVTRPLYVLVKALPSALAILLVLAAVFTSSLAHAAAPLCSSIFRTQSVQSSTYIATRQTHIDFQNAADVFEEILHVDAYWQNLSKEDRNVVEFDFFVQQAKLQLLEVHKRAGTLDAEQIAKLETFLNTHIEAHTFTVAANYAFTNLAARVLSGYKIENVRYGNAVDYLRAPIVAPLSMKDFNDFFGNDVELLGVIFEPMLTDGQGYLNPARFLAHDDQHFSDARELSRDRRVRAFMKSLTRSRADSQALEITMFYVTHEFPSFLGAQMAKALGAKTQSEFDKAVSTLMFRQNFYSPMPLWENLAKRLRDPGDLGGDLELNLKSNLNAGQTVRKGVEELYAALAHATGFKQTLKHKLQIQMIAR